METCLAHGNNEKRSARFDGCVVKADSEDGAHLFKLFGHIAPIMVRAIRHDTKVGTPDFAPGLCKDAGRVYGEEADHQATGVVTGLNMPATKSYLDDFVSSYFTRELEAVCDNAGA